MSAVGAIGITIRYRIPHLLVIMRKIFNEAAKSFFIEKMREQFPGYVHKKSQRGPLPGGAVLQLKVDSSRIGWIVFGGFKERDFFLGAAWTVSGLKLQEIPEWEPPPNPRAFVPSLPPKDGHVDIRDRWRFEAAPHKWFSIELPEPDSGLRERIYSHYVSSPSFEVDVQSSYEGMLKIHTRNPKSLSEVRDQRLAAERALCSLWSHLADRHQFSDQELGDLVRGPVEFAISLVAKYAHPLIQRQLFESEPLAQQDDRQVSGF